ncbi:ParB/RepB/Spo0J family partition protein [Xanthomonas theicola]|nr:ParB/RepB/Spo0J family partition protein [Xanthomonas theicola]QNH27211.1 ParB/RepB/Spo0J family partition protein [Xanthomonas theicola]
MSKNKTSDLRLDALDALAGADAPELVLELELGDICPDPNQPRTEKDPDYLAELAASLRKHGQLDPIKVRENPQPGGTPYMLMDGECRWLAAADAKLGRLRALLIADALDADAILDRQFAANVHRDNMTLADQARYLEKRRQGRTLEQLSELCSLSVPRISKILATASATGSAAEARDAGLTKDAETVTALGVLEKHDPAAAAAIVSDAKASGGKIKRGEVAAKVKEAKGKAKSTGAGKGKDSSDGTLGHGRKTPGGGSWEAPRAAADGVEYASVRLENDGPLHGRNSKAFSGPGFDRVPRVFVEWASGDGDPEGHAEHKTYFEQMVKQHGRAFLCRSAGSSLEGHALVEFAKKGAPAESATEDFPYYGLRIVEVEYAAG